MTAYTSYMISQAQLGGVENASQQSCVAGYNWIGKELKRPGEYHELYGNW